MRVIRQSTSAALARRLAAPTESRLRSTLGMKVTGWSNGLEVTADGEGIVSHAGLALLRRWAAVTELPAACRGALVLIGC